MVINMKQILERDWWKKSVVYQIYPRSFQDSNGDGIGDIPGIIKRIGYLSELGIDVIWLSPVYCSPQDDNGYDISDYQNIDPMFGTMEDMEGLIRAAGQRGIKIVMDLVLNHTSDEHPWFQEAKKGRDNPYHNYYIWKDGEEGMLPNGLKSSFGGSAWEWVPEVGQYFLHQYSVKQPDLNWDNPKVQNELYKMIQWWMRKGVGGFRLDVIDKIAKEPDRMILKNGTNLHQYIKELSKETFQKGNILTVGETWGATPENAKLYSNPDGSEFSMIFQFEHMCLDRQEGKTKWELAPVDFIKLKKVLSKWQNELYGKGWNSLFWNNHDLPRIVSRWGNDGKYRIESAKMLAILLYGIQGTPYIYQGEELGMTNVAYGIEEYRDIETLNLYKERLEKGYGEDEVMLSIHAKSRDNARTPMQWDEGENAGFSEGKPWMKVNPNYKEINAAQQIDDQNSIFRCYKELIFLRKNYPVFIEGNFRLLLSEDENIFTYIREDGDVQLLVVCNFFGQTIECPLGESAASMKLLINNYKDIGQISILRPYEARMYLKENSLVSQKES